jgi:hypothetical protein
MLRDSPLKTLALSVSEKLHKRLHWEAAQQVADFSKISVKFNAKTAPEKYEPILQHLLHTLLERGGMSEAAGMLWTPNQFTAEPQSVKDVWELFETSDMGLIMGAAKMGKSFSMGARLFLEWIRDPEWTSIRVLGPSENHLEQNLFSHLVALHSHATLPMPGAIGDLFIGLDRRDQLSSIRGVVIPKGTAKKAGKLQGSHRRPRPNPHPLFGPLSRMFLFIDEIENVPNGVWLDVDNVLSEIEEQRAGQLDLANSGFKIFGAYNPTNSADEVAKRAEPLFGYPDLDEDKHFRWKSKRGWDVLRIDGERCENVIHKRIIFPGLQTCAGLEKIAQNAGGRTASGYRTMGRGMYPSQGLDATVIPAGMLGKWVGEFIWVGEPVSVGSTDLALEGGDPAIYTIGKFGLASGIKWPPSLDFPEGKTSIFRDRNGHVTPRWGLQALRQFAIPPAETVGMKNGVLTVNRKGGVRGEYYACDRTGHGAGVADLLRYEWSSAIHDVNYSEGAGTDKIMVEDSKPCNEAYERMYSVLWFATRAWGEFNYLLLHPSMDLSKLGQQLTLRRFQMSAGKSKVESKKDYKSRGFESPNEADSLTLLVHAARKGSGLVLSMRGDTVTDPNDPDDDWPTPGMRNGVMIDESNRSDWLNSDANDQMLRDTYDSMIL